MNDTTIGAEMRRYLTWLQRTDAEVTRTKEEWADLARSCGYRIVSGGQIAPDLWEIRDAETEEILAIGSSLEDYEKAWHKNWLHTEAVHNWTEGLVPDANPIIMSGSSLPESLMQALCDWACWNEDDVSELLHIPGPDSNTDRKDW